MFVWECGLNSYRFKKNNIGNFWNDDYVYCLNGGI